MQALADCVFQSDSGGMLTLSVSTEVLLSDARQTGRVDGVVRFAMHGVVSSVSVCEFEFDFSTEFSEFLLDEDVNVALRVHDFLHLTQVACLLVGLGHEKALLGD